ncbi:hypothetical protein [Pseudomonas poae]|uniref:hypothetical protein n=1 Tax=Pseudomonas poae TaxID=200451 RepID=UPI0030D1CB73
MLLSLDETPLQSDFELHILKRLLNNLPEKFAHARTLFGMCASSDGRARHE